MKTVTVRAPANANKIEAALEKDAEGANTEEDEAEETPAKESAQ